MKFKVCILSFVLLFPFSVAMAQTADPEPRLHLRRTFGYQAGARIQGSFSLEVTGVVDIARVDYVIDGKILATTVEPPYRVSFSTGAHDSGVHVLAAIATTTEGVQIESPGIQVEFITAEQSWNSAGRVVAWILCGALAVMLISVFGTGFLTRGRDRFKLGVYGAAGGAVCRRCQLPFGRHFFSPNLLIGKLERCPHCGRIAIVPRASHDVLARAEARYRQEQVKGLREVRHGDADLKQRLENSRFED